MSHTPAKTRVSGFRHLPAFRTRLRRSQSTFLQQLNTPDTPKPASGVPYYGYRFYSPELGRWMSRDPIEEDGGLNLYSMVLNNPLSHFDFMGLSLWDNFLNSRIADWLMCMGDCISDNDPINNFIPKLVAVIGNASVPKTVVVHLYRSLGMLIEAKKLEASLKIPGMSQWGAIPNALRTILTNKLQLQRMGAGAKALRAFGKFGQGAVIVLGTFEIAVQAHCAGWCCGARQYDPSANMWVQTYEGWQEIINNIVNDVTKNP